MNKKEATQILAVLRASYPTDYMNIKAEEAQGIVSVWSMQFADMPADIVLMALNKVVSTKPKPPTIAEVKAKIHSIHWEAYEKIAMNYNQKNLSAEELGYYKKIYEATSKYKHSKNVELSIVDMLPNKEVKQIKEGSNN